MEPMSFVKDEELEDGYMERIRDGEVTLRDQCLLIARACDAFMGVIQAIPERVRRNFVSLDKEAEAVALMLSAVRKEEREAAAEILGGVSGTSEAEPDGEVQDA